MSYKFDQLSLLPGAYSDTKDNITYLDIKAYELPSQQAFGRTVAELLTKGKHQGTWNFIAPNEIQENISHDWGEYDSMISRLAQKGMNLMKSAQLIANTTDLVKSQAGGIFDAAKKVVGNSTSNIKGDLKNLDATNILEGGLRLGSGVFRGEKAFQGKVDTAFIYQDSKRREYTFTLLLGDMGGGSSKRLYNQIVEPIQKLEALSCPILNVESIISIGFPAVFTIEVLPSRIITLDGAALTAVTPTYYGPYIDGYPTSCEVGLTFNEIAPLYRYLIDTQKKGLVTTEPSFNFFGR